MLTLGSPAFQQILKDCLAHGALCQIKLAAKGELEALLKRQFKDPSFGCEECDKLTSPVEKQHLCLGTQPCYHIINNAKITSIKIVKEEPTRCFTFFYSATFQSKLRPKNEELMTITIDDDGSFVSEDIFDENSLFKELDMEIEDCKAKLPAPIFDKLKAVSDQRLDALVKEKLVLFDLPLVNSRKVKLCSFAKRLRRSYHDQMISKKQDFDDAHWQANYQALLKREEQSLLTNVAIKLLNLLIINTVKVRFEVKLENKSTIHAFTTLGFSDAPEVVCPICRKSISEGYATADQQYVCKNCYKQSIDTAKIYSIKASMRLDESLHEYIEPDSGFVCSVCGKRHSRLLEFKCSHDNSSVCIYHYELCDKCGKIFSKLNLSHTDEFKRLLCPKHANEK